ncbi:MAG TPA: tetratricopeptide repeat protein [Rhizomicrobium sp.]
MNKRILSALIAAAAFFLSPAQAAITVLGSGPAQLCYQAADQGLSPLDYIAYCDQALVGGGLSPADRAATYINRGVLKLAMNSLDGATADFNAGLAIDDRLGEAYVNRGATLIAKRRYAEALADLNRGLALGIKQTHLAYFDRAMAFEALGNLQGAYDDYRKALALRPDFQLASDELKRFRVVEKPSGT